MNRVLIISPHSDDAELGCGGYMAKMAQSGAEVFTAIMTTSSTFFQHLNRTVSNEERLAEAHAASRILGSTVIHHSCGSDRCLDLQPLRLMILRIESLLDQIKPTQLLIPLPSTHQDHEALHKACMAALRPSRMNGLQLIAAYEYTGSRWGPSGDMDASRGGLYVDLTEEHLNLKKQALRCFKTQIREAGHAWSIEAVNAMASLRGIECGSRYAELFYILQEKR